MPDMTTPDPDVLFARIRALEERTKLLEAVLIPTASFAAGAVVYLADSPDAEVGPLFLALPVFLGAAYWLLRKTGYIT